MVGFKVIGSEGEREIVTHLSNGNIAAGDAVNLVTDGQVEPAGAGEPIYGVALNTVVGAGNVVYIERGARLKVIADNDLDSATFTATEVGARFDLIGGTGAMKIDTSSQAQAGTESDTGQFLCTEYNPQGYGLDDDTSIGVFEVIERQ